MFGHHHKDKNKPKKEEYRVLTAPTPIPTPVPSHIPTPAIQLPPAPTTQLKPFSPEDCFKAAKFGDLDYIQQKVNADNVNTLMQDGCYLLHTAAFNGKTEIVRYLLKLKANVNARTTTDIASTPLHFAAQQGKVDCMVLLIEAGAEIDAKEKENLTTPLNRAIWNREVAAVKLLISHHASVDTRNNIGSTLTSLLIASNDKTDSSKDKNSQGDFLGERDNETVIIRLFKLLIENNVNLNVKAYNRIEGGKFTTLNEIAIAYKRMELLSLIEAAQKAQSLTSDVFTAKIDKLQTSVEHLTSRVHKLERQLQQKPVADIQRDDSPSFVKNPFSP